MRRVPLLREKPVDGQRPRRPLNLGPETLDLHLIFPPQWSPFQPSLGTPSLRAYLVERGYRIRQSDWNMGFYRFFIDQARVEPARRRLERMLTLNSTPDKIDMRLRPITAFATLAEHT